MAAKESPNKRVIVPLIGQPSVRPNTDPAASTDQIFSNCVFKKFNNPVVDGSAPWYAVAKRPGFNSQDSGTTPILHAMHGTLGASVIPSSASHIFVKRATNDLSFVGMGGTTNVTPTGNAASTSAIARPVEGLDSNGDPVQLTWHQKTDAARSTCQAFIHDYVNNTVTEITDADFPDTLLIGSFVYMDGYTFVMTTTGRIYNSALNDPTSWDATAYISTSVPAGATGRGIVKYKDMIVAFTTNSIEFFKNVGNTNGSVLQRISELTIYGYGLDATGEATSGVSAQARASYWYYAAEDTVYWANSATTKAGLGLYRLNGVKPEKISTNELDRRLAAAGTEYLKILGSFTLLGTQYLLCAALADLLVYDVANNIFTFWNEPAASTNTIWPATSTPSRQYFYSTEGVAYSFEASTGESATPYSTSTTLSIQTRLIDFGTNKRKRINRVRLVGNAVSGTVSLSWSKDDYATFSTARTASFSDNAATYNNLGMGRRWSFKIEHSALAYCQFDYLEIEYTELDK